MPRYLTITPKYNPITLQEYLTVPQMLYEESEQRQKEFDTLEDSVSAYETYARQYPNSEASKQFLNYLDKFNQTADSFYKNPLASSVRSDMLNLRRDFKRVTTPFKQAVATYNTIAQQRAKDTNKGIIGKGIDFEYLLSHPEYTAEMDRGSYVLGEDVLKYSSNLFKGLTGWDTTPITEPSADGSFSYVYTPQGYTTEDYITALTGEGSGKVTPELEKAVKTARDNFNYDSLDETSKAQIDRILLSAASKYTKEDRVSVRNAPRGYRIAKGGKVEPKYKGYTPVVTDNGEVLYKKNSQYYKPAQGNDGNTYMSPVTNDVTMGGQTFKQKPNAAAGTLIADTTKTVTPFYNYNWRIPFIGQTPISAQSTSALAKSKKPVVKDITTTEDSEGFDW